MRRSLPFVLALLAVTAAAQEPVIDEPSMLELEPPSEEPQAQQSGMRLGILGGGLVSMSSGASTAAAPMLRLSIEAALAKYQRPPRLFVNAELGALPGETLSVEEAETFRSLEFSVGLGWKPDADWFFSIYGVGGFATRLPADPEPIERTARFASLGVRFADEAGENTLDIGTGPDQRLNGTYQWCGHLSGAVKLWQEGGGGKVKLSLFGRAILGLDPSFESDIHSAPGDVVQLGIAVKR